MRVGEKYTHTVRNLVKYDLLRDQRIYIRVTKQEKKIIEKLAKCQCLDTSNFIRWLIF